MKKKYSDTYKNKEIAKIHIAKQQLGMDDDTYRAMLQGVAGVSSSKQLTATGRAQVLEALRKKGFSDKAHIKNKPNTLESRSPQARARQLQKIEALLADAGRPWDYVIKMASHMYKKQALEFCDAKELQGLIAALEKDKKRRNQAAQKEQ